MKKQRGFIDLDGAIAALVVVGIFIGFVLFVGVPLLWGFLKPWIHSITG